MRKISYGSLLGTAFICVAMLWIKEFALLGAAAIAGTSWSILSARAKLREIWNRIPRALGKTVYWLAMVSVSVTMVVFVKTYLLDLLRLPSNSMAPNFRSGQIVVINKLSIGPRLDAHHIDRYTRANGFSSIKRFDIAVFNFPISDSLPLHAVAVDTASKSNFIATVLDRYISIRPRYIKRIVALPGDTFEIRSGQAFVNNLSIKGRFNQIARYKTIGPNAGPLLKASHAHIYNSCTYKKDTLVELSTLTADSLHLQCIALFSLEKDMPDPNIFPHTFFWNSDHIGPVVIPQKGATVSIDHKNIDLYKRIIKDYEGNMLDIKKTDIFINGAKARSYTFKLNYYWVMGDNQPHSFDSRYWGFLPENHIIGVSRTHFNIGF
ncbi:MAG: signal peptidase I [Breznakibacter sp.]